MKKIVISVLCVIITLGAVSSYLYWNANIAPKKIMYYSSQVGYNPYDPREQLGNFPYVFVGFVEETHDYMTERRKREFPKIIKEIDRPMTECKVTVIKNIKGNLIEGISFSLYKSGGLSKNPRYIAMEQGDLIPESGKYYIFIGLAHADGTLTVGGLNDAIELESGITADNLDNSLLYQEYVDAFNNQTKPHYTYWEKNCLAAIDRDFGDGSYNEKVYQEILKEETERTNS